MLCCDLFPNDSVDVEVAYFNLIQFSSYPHHSDFVWSLLFVQSQRPLIEHGLSYFVSVDFRAGTLGSF